METVMCKGTVEDHQGDCDVYRDSLRITKESVMSIGII